VNRHRAPSLLVLALCAACTRAEPSAPSGAVARTESKASGAPAVSGGDPGFDDAVGDVVGHRAAPWEVSQWLNTAPLALDDLRGKVVAVRWFMSPNCPLCSASAPGLVALDQRYKARGLAVVGMYHHKDEEPLDPEKVKGYVAHFGFTFPVGIDKDWKTLHRWWLDGHHRQYTSVTFLIDRRGVVRHVHLGGKLAPGAVDFATFEARVQDLLAEPAP
jgi:peroxiredoxin